MLSKVIAVATASALLVLSSWYPALAASGEPQTSAEPNVSQSFKSSELTAEELQTIEAYSRAINRDPNTTITELTAFAETEGMSKPVVMNTIVEMMAGTNPDSLPETVLAESQGKSSIKKTKGYPLIPGGANGDMFRSDASIGINGVIAFHFGHVGLYENKTTVIEAGNCGPDPRHQWGVYRTPVSRECWANTGLNRAFVSGRRGHGRSSLINNTAISRAREWVAARRPYNIDFLHNKHNQGTGPLRAFNCSQLVWSAYLPYVDLDHDLPDNPAVKWNDFVMPNEIINHSQTNKY